MKVSNEIKTGVFVAAGIGILIIGYYFLKGASLFTNDKTYYVVYIQADELSTSDPVTFNGFTIGKVAGLDLVDDTSRRTVATIALETEVRIPRNSVFEIYDLDILGEKAVKLLKGDSRDFAQPGDTLKGAIALPLIETISKEILPVRTKFFELLDSQAVSNQTDFAAQWDSVMQAVRIVLKEEEERKRAEGK